MGGWGNQEENRKKEKRSETERDHTKGKKEIKDRKGRSGEKLLAPLPQVSTCISWAT